MITFLNVSRRRREFGENEKGQNKGLNTIRALLPKSGDASYSLAMLTLIY